MHSPRAILCLLLCAGALCRAAEPEAELPWTIESRGDVVWEVAMGLAVATNGIIVRRGDTVLSAQRASVNQVTGEVIAEGGVRIEHQGLLFTGDRVRYNFRLRRFVGEDIKTGQTPVFVKGEVMVADVSNNVYVAAQSMVTTDDYARPGYSVRAKTMTIVPGEFIEAKGATLYLGDTPVFYYPSYRRRLERHPRFWTFVPGYRSKYGPFLLSSYNWDLNEHLRATVHVDGYVKRGVGLGPDLDWKLPRWGDGIVKYYYIRDQDPEDSSTGLPLDPDRQRAYFSHLGALRTNLTLRSVVAYQSDPDIVRDFFETEYRRNVQPNSFVEINQAWPNFGLNLLVQPRVNDFWQSVERLPDLKFTGLRQQVGVSPLYYESESSAGYYQQKFPVGNTNPPYPAFSTNVAYSAARFDTYHQFTLPRTYFNWLNVTPRAGGRFTYYSEADGPGASTQDEYRGVFNTGAEVSFKASRLWLGPQNKFWQVDGLRHILEPSFNYAYVPEPNVLPTRLPQFDYTLPTTQLLPILFPDFTAIDSVASQNVLRLGLRNKLQTKRRDGLDNLVNWALFTDWYLSPPTNDTSFSPVYSTLDLKPFAWLTFNSGLRINPDAAKFDATEHGLTFTPNDTWSLNVGHHYLRDYPGVPNGTGYEILRLGGYYRIDQNWAARYFWMRQLNQGTYTEHILTLYRDFRSWTGALSLRLRDDPSGDTDVTVAVTFSLKAYPRYSVGDDTAPSTLLLGN
jgi:lipopolysaccharide assembly outer membrane protein LptD (OstA)